MQEKGTGVFEGVKVGSPRGLIKSGILSLYYDT